jgi:DNA-binding MarR family transcriptional regulator
MTIDPPLDFTSALEKRMPDVDPDLVVILGALTRLGRILDWDLQRLARPAGLEKTEHWTLSALWAAGPDSPLTPTELSSIVLQTTSGMTKTLRRLEAAGLVERFKDQDDGRRQRIRLTAAGNRLIERDSRRLVARWHDKFEVATPLQRTELARALSSFLAIAEESFSTPLATNELNRQRSTADMNKAAT